MQYSQQALDKMTLRVKELQEDNKLMKEKIKTLEVQRKEKFIQLKNKDIKCLSFQKSNHRQIQKIKQNLQQKQNELNDLNKIPSIDKNDLLFRKKELVEVLEDLKKKNDEINKLKEEAYEEFAKKRKEALEQEKINAQKAKTEDVLKSFEEILELVNIEKKNEALSPETLKAIFHAFAVYMADAFSKLIDEYRLARRAKKINNKQLLLSFKIHEEKVKALIAEKQKEYLAKLNIQFDFIIKSINFHASKGNKEVNHLFAYLTQKLKILRNAKKDLSTEELKAAWLLQRSLLQKHQTEFVELLHECQHARVLPDQAFAIAQLKLGDYLFAELKIEEEDLMKAHKLIDSSNDQELKHAVFCLPKEIQKIMRQRLSTKQTTP